MINLVDLNKYYGTGKNKFHALDNINLSVEEGEFVSIEGQSGAGKSTLLHILGFLGNFNSGDYQFKQKNVKQMNDDKKSKLRNSEIGFVLQDFCLINQKSVLFNVMLPLFFSKTPYRKIRKAAKEALKNVGIEDQMRKRVNQLSGGQKQRVAIARALVTQPSLILADEPTGALDSKTSEQIMELLSKINAEQNITIIVVTHSSLVSKHCKRKIIMSDGRIISDDEQ